ncbi:hypothetical protein P153DRAFT_396450 [Dothidotthia symphoricarpi CBS 119687]|uniref:Uncharacterized protein n=1 Tax=Dothidotthia symphoricarpi CBS 119687 TaxID=1392245 RepID=A0A6A6AE87_9PLEO|nr:uncharacterized protein P153DRAFT_396450 [Dothidotthia symphoricarpi CBS 119687]KAF2130120.1 hypothetical protein P153DRAFT_396450 [Dothidotthia symphoricarpi CBS 119687]
MSTPAPLIYINAFPGTGKLTIARALLPLLPPSHSPPILLDTHTLIDPVATHYARTHPAYQPARKAERARVFALYVENVQYRGSVVVVTGLFLLSLPLHTPFQKLTTHYVESRSTTPHEVRITREFVDAAARAGRRFIPIILLCGVGENMRRVASEERKRSGTTKIVCPERVRGIRAGSEIYRFGVGEELVMDVTCLEAGDAAARIAEWVGRVMEGGVIGEVDENGRVD